MNNQIAIVGAGIAGLTAGYFLEQAGYHPIVFEKSGRVGGRMITDCVDGFNIDCGAQFLMDSYPILTSLIANNGLSNHFTETSQYLGEVIDGRIRKTSRNNPLSLLATGTLGFQAWFRFLLRSIPLMRKTSNLSMNDSQLDGIHPMTKQRISILKSRPTELGQISLNNAIFDEIKDRLLDFEDLIELEIRAAIS